jgi:hypothetical protein
MYSNTFIQTDTEHTRDTIHTNNSCLHIATYDLTNSSSPQPNENKTMTIFQFLKHLSLLLSRQTHYSLERIPDYLSSRYSTLSYRIYTTKI